MDCAVVIVAAAPSAVVVVGGVEDDDKSNEDNVKRLALFLSLRLDLFIRVEVCLLVGWLFNVHLLRNGLYPVVIVFAAASAVIVIGVVEDDDNNQRRWCIACVLNVYLLRNGLYPVVIVFAAASAVIVIGVVEDDDNNQRRWCIACVLNVYLLMIGLCPVVVVVAVASAVVVVDVVENDDNASEDGAKYLSCSCCWPLIFFRMSRFVCWFVCCLTSQQHASVSQGRICPGNCTCCHTETKVADKTFHLTQSPCTDTGPTSSCAYLKTPGRVATGVPISKSLA